MGTLVNTVRLPFHSIAVIPFRVQGWEMDTPSIRRRNFKMLVDKVWDGHRALAAQALGFEAPNLVTRYMSDGKSAKPIGLRLARKMEIAARAAGATWAHTGWMDVPHEDAPTPPPGSRRPGTLEDRIRALPEPLRAYVLMELDICEQVKDLAAVKVLRAPSIADRQAFQAYLLEALAQSSSRSAA